MDNEVWKVGRYIFRMPLDEEGEARATLESQLSQLAFAAGVMTPRLIVFDTSKDIVPRSFGIYELVPGETLGTLACSPDRTRPVIARLAGELAKLHAAPLALAAEIQETSAGESVRDNLERAQLDQAGKALFRGWIEKLGPAFEATFRPTLIHNDVHPWNVLVDPSTMALTALIDWGDGGIGDPALDLCGFPVWGMLQMVDEYREITQCEDELLEARVLREWISLTLWESTFLEDGVYRRDWWRLPQGGASEIAEAFAPAGNRWRRWLP